MTYDCVHRDLRLKGGIVLVFKSQTKEYHCLEWEDNNFCELRSPDDHWVCLHL